MKKHLLLQHLHYFVLSQIVRGTARISYTGAPLASKPRSGLLAQYQIHSTDGKKSRESTQLVINSQFKLFLRAHDIEPLDFDKVKLSKQNKGLVINNDTPYHLTIKHILVGDKRYPFNDFC